MTDTEVRTSDGRRERRRRWPWWVAGLLALMVVLGFIVPPIFDERMRSTIESQMNARLEGYSVTLDDVDLHLFGLSFSLHELTVIQDAHPDPPVVYVPTLRTSVQWDALLRGRLVADFLFDRPEFHIHLEQLREEMVDEVPVDERGWREALEAAHFFEFNLIRIRDGTLTYIDDDPDRPLEAEDIQFFAADIRAAAGPEDPYPSPFRLEAIVFGDGRLQVDGSADFLAEPNPVLRANFDTADVPLDHFRPVLARAGVIVSDGVLDAAGYAEIGHETQLVHFAVIHGRHLHADYVYTEAVADDDEAEDEEADDALLGDDDDDDEDANNGDDNGGNDDNGNANGDDGNGNASGNDADDEASDDAGAVEAMAEGPDPRELQLLIDRLELSGDLGFVHEGVDPSFRAFVSDLRLVLTNYSNRFREGEGRATLEGRFMGSGETRATATFRPEDPAPDFELALEIRDTHLPAMNDMLRAYGNFDVHDGHFSFFTELTIHDGHIDGYMRPLFGDMEVYDAREDDDKGLIQQLYEMAVGAIAGILENLPREEVATHAEISGDLDDPEMNTWEIIVGLVQNAFFQAILPGFEDQLDD